jgi:hypothetical protein
VTKSRTPEHLPADAGRPPGARLPAQLIRVHRRDAATRQNRQALGLPGNDPASALLLSVTNRVTGPARIAAVLFV